MRRTNSIHSVNNTIFKSNTSYLRKLLQNLFFLATTAMVVGCGGGSTETINVNETTNNTDQTETISDDTTTTEASTTRNGTVFPSSIAVSSPTSASSNITTGSVYIASASGVVNDYDVATDLVSQIIAGNLTPREEIYIEDLFNAYQNARCYGPLLEYENHPNASATDSEWGELPSGDVGIWKETEGDSDEACAAAQLNARMEGIQQRQSTSLLLLASMITAYESDGVRSWPDDVSPGTTIDLTEQMNALFIYNTDFTSATMTLDNNGSLWRYDLALTISYGYGQFDAIVSLDHIRGVNENSSEGLLNIRFNSDGTGTQCGDANESTMNTSLHYAQSSATSILLQYRETQFCGTDINGIQTPVNSDEISGNIVSSTTSSELIEDWDNSFTIFTADFNPTDLSGSYSYAWQAGYNDSHSRILNIAIDENQNAEAYFGFGSRVQNTDFDGSLLGFICNWSGPGNDHTPMDYLQHQSLTLNLVSGDFVLNGDDASHITYAPTNSCLYDSAESAASNFGITFDYDRDLNQLLRKTDVVDVVLEVTDADLQLPFGLMTLPENSGAENVWDHVINEGYQLPMY